MISEEYVKALRKIAVLENELRIAKKKIEKLEDFLVLFGEVV
jgi:hypothetical protein